MPSLSCDRPKKKKGTEQLTSFVSPCGVPAVLRVVTKKKENWGRYFWMCHAGNVPGKEACDFFRWAEFDEDGNPVELKQAHAKREEG